MTRFVSPPKKDLDKMRQPLTPGEHLVFEFFDRSLPEEWEIYIQPHLNGLRPDFVLLNPKVGIAVFEVKDWDLSAMQYFVKERPPRAPILLGVKDGKEFSLQHENPIEKVKRYEREICSLYCPRLDGRAGQTVVTAGVIFPFSNGNDVRSLFSSSMKYHGVDKYSVSSPYYHPLYLSGADDIQKGRIEVVFPECQRKASKSMSEDLAKDFRNWLVEPDFAAVQRDPLDVDKTKKRLITSRAKSGKRRIKGPAGSGKSLVLAARAAELTKEGKQVLVVTYNITLLHYLMDLAIRWPHSGGDTRRDITWLNFHEWCKRVCFETDTEIEYNEMWKDHFVQSEYIPRIEGITDEKLKKVLAEGLPVLVKHVIEKDTEDRVQKYDAILVDEGQDFLPEWWNALRLVCRENGEMLLVADTTQDVYERSRYWTENRMIGVGFEEPWIKFNVSYRLSPDSIKYIRAFAQRFLPQKLIDLPVPVQKLEPGFPELENCKLKWVQTDKRNAANACVREILLLAPSADPDILSIPDITFLTNSQQFGLDVVSILERKGVRIAHTFSLDDKESRRLKSNFFMGNARIKATTLHSFKGWETRALVLHIGINIRDYRNASLIYTGLTRVKKHLSGSYLTVVSTVTDRTLVEYGKSWPEFKKVP